MPTAVFRSRLTRTLASAGVALLMLGVISGCGGGSSKTTSSTTTSSSTTTTTTPAKPKPKPKLEQTARVDTSGAKYASTVAAKDGDIVQFRTVVPPSKHPGPVGLKITQAHGRIDVTASANHQTSTASVTGTGLKLSRVHYACELPPAPSFCPVSHVIVGASGYQVQFPSKPKTPIVLSGKVAAATPPAVKLNPTSTAAVPPYILTQKVKVTTPSKSGGSGQTSKPTSAATVHAGDVVDLTTYVGGKVAGALQPVTMTIDQGPAKTVTITATEPGGASSHATISGAGGAQIALVSPRYNCFLPPDPTFCPSSKLLVGHRKYSITFRVTPNKSPIEVVANVQPG